MPRIPSILGPSFPSSCGTLSKLPQEVRDKIYRYLVKGQYIINTETLADVPSFHTDFTILQASKTIRHEATSLLYSESIFNLLLNVSSPFDPFRQLPPLTADRIMKLTYHILDETALLTPLFNSNPLPTLTQPSTSTPQTLPPTPSLFTTPPITRTRLHILLYSLPSPFDPLTSPLIHSLKKLHGFRVLSIESHRWLSDAETEDIGRTSALMWDTMHVIEKYLESALGPVVDRRWGFGEQSDYRICIVFSPDAFWRERAGREGAAGEGDG